MGIESHSNPDEGKLDFFPDVTKAYINLYEINQRCEQELRKCMLPLVGEVNRKLFSVLEFVNKKENTSASNHIHLWKTGNGGNVYLYWDESGDQIDPFFITVDEVTPNKLEKASRLVINIPGVTRNLAWSKFNPVYYDLDRYTNILVENNSGDKKFDDLFQDYFDKKESVENTFTKKIEEFELPIMNGVFELTDIVQKYRLPFLYKLLNGSASDRPILLDYIISELGKGKNMGVFFLPDKKILIRAPLVSGREKDSFAYSPDMKNAKTAQRADWFRMGEIIRRKLVVLISYQGWDRPTVNGISI